MELRLVPLCRGSLGHCPPVGEQKLHENTSQGCSTQGKAETFSLIPLVHDKIPSPSTPAPRCLSQLDLLRDLRDLIPAIPQKCTPKMHGEPQGKLCSLYPSVSKHPGFKKGISERKQKKAHFSWPVYLGYPHGNPALFPWAQQECWSSLPEETNRRESCGNRRESQGNRQEFQGNKQAGIPRKEA